VLLPLSLLLTLLTLTLLHECHVRCTVERCDRRKN
jgi:hypothetical protein